MSERHQNHPGSVSGLVLEFSDAAFGQKIHLCGQRDRDQGEWRGDEGRRDGSDIDELAISFHWLVSDYLNQHSLPTSPVEFAVENLFPRAEIQFALGNCDDDFAAHDLTLEVGVSVVFAGAIMPIKGGRCMWRQCFQPQLVIVVKPRFIVIDKHRGSDVHGVDETEAFGDAASVNKLLDLRRDVDEPTSIGDFEPKMFSERFQ
jgi:hypothetical protein